MIYCIYGGFIMKDLDKELAYQVFEKSEEIKLLKKQIKDKYKQMELIVKNNLKSSKKIV